MRSSKQRIGAAVAAVAIALALLSGLGTASVHASGRPHKAQGNIPDSCFWFGDASQSGNLYNTNGSVAGYYEVITQHYSCTTSWHRAFGEFVITASQFTCTTPYFNLYLYANFVQVEAAFADPGLAIGGSSTTGCNSRTSYSLTTATYNGSGFAYCAEMNSITFGGSLNNLKAGSSCP